MREKKIKCYKEQNPEKIAAYLRGIKSIPKSQIAYVDETGIDTYLYREYFWSLKGRGTIGLIRGKKYRRTGIVAAKMDGRILAPLQYDVTMDSLLFETWFETVLMAELPDSSAIVMDNAAFHRKLRLIPIAEKYGYRLIFLPPYSSELNPIENFWAWLKAKLRSVLADFSCFDDAVCYYFEGM